MAEEKRFLDSLKATCASITQTLKSSDDWNARYKALEQLEELAKTGSQYEAFGKRIQDYTEGLADGLVRSITDLRSELVRQASSTISVVAQNLGDFFRKGSMKLIKPVVDVASSRNGVIRGYASKCLPPLLQNVHSKNTLFTILEIFNGTKSTITQEVTVDALRIVLAFWPISSKYAEYADVLQEAVADGLQSQTTTTRTLACKCFWLFVGHFPERRDKFFNSLDARTRKLVEKGKSVEEEEQEYMAATKINAVLKGHLARKKYRSSLNLSGKSLRVGMRVRVGLNGDNTDQKGVIRWIGSRNAVPGDWIGVETDAPAEGNTDGVLDGEKLIDCAPKRAVFVPPGTVRPDEPVAALTAPRPASAAVGKVVVKPKAAKEPDDDDEEVIHPITKNFSFKQALRVELSGAGQSDGKDDSPSFPGDKPQRKLTATPLVPLESGGLLGASVPSDSNQAARGTLRRQFMERAAHGALGVPAADHKRTMSIPALNEREVLLKEHKFHLQVMAEAFQKEMDLLEGVETSGTQDDKYIDNMLALLGKLSQTTNVLKSKFADYKRRLQNLSDLDDDFLEKMDAFKKLPG